MKDVLTSKDGYTGGLKMGKFTDIAIACFVVIIGVVVLTRMGITLGMVISDIEKFIGYYP